MVTAILVLSVLILLSVWWVYAYLRGEFRCMSESIDSIKAERAEHKTTISEPIRAHKNEIVQQTRTKGDTLASKRSFKSVAQRRADAVQASAEEQERRDRKLAADIRAFEG